MTDFEKLKKQTLPTDVWMGLGLKHNQPKDHEIHSCNATINNIYKDSIQISIWFKDSNDIFVDGTKFTVRKSHVVEESDQFRILIEPENTELFIVFLVPKKYF